MTNKERQQILLALFEQYYLHSRHVENERLWFTNVYAIIVSGVLAFLSRSEKSVFTVWLFLFLFLLSLLGLVIAVKLNFEFRNHMDNLKEILRNLDVPNDLFIKITLTDKALAEKSLLWKCFRVGYAFIVLYVFMSLVWFLLALNMISIP